MAGNYIQVRVPEGQDAKTFGGFLTETYAGLARKTGGKIVGATPDKAYEDGSVLCVRTKGGATPSQQDFIQKFAL